ncbi:hypothetical protein COLO4_05375 [Corchorus olitorius]|uniref:Uncharacterized protein n=1 Tax=Corchorus olitorius TaxID=93759 RepID=A0A1R3KR09_9ROSI|nr:hypothetical protein COLO4_05375 [Corchorus olitorius]
MKCSSFSFESKLQNSPPRLAAVSASNSGSFYCKCDKEERNLSWRNSYGLWC